jgi:hypothetical protein
MPQNKRKSVLEALVNRLREMGEQLGPLLKGRPLQPAPIPVRTRE